MLASNPQSPAQFPVFQCSGCMSMLHQITSISSPRFVFFLLILRHDGLFACLFACLLAWLRQGLSIQPQLPQNLLREKEVQDLRLAFILKCGHSVMLALPAGTQQQPSQAFHWSFHWSHPPVVCDIKPVSFASWQLSSLGNRCLNSLFGFRCSIARFALWLEFEWSRPWNCCKCGRYTHSLTCLLSFLFWVLTLERQNFCGCLFQFVWALMLLRALSKNPVPLSGKYACYSSVFSLVVLVLVFKWFDPAQMNHSYADLFIIAVSVRCVGSGCYCYSCWGQRQLVESVLSCHLGSGGLTQTGGWVWQGFYLVSRLTDPANQFLCGVKCQWEYFFRSSCKNGFFPELLKCPDWNQVTRAWLCLYSVCVRYSIYLPSKNTTLHYGWDLHYVLK